jgi:hypothetical protein
MNLSKNLILTAIFVFISVCATFGQAEEKPAETVAAKPEAAITLPADEQFTADLFTRFAEMRTGTGAPVYWYCIGEIYSYPDGKLIARVEGVDTARYIKSESNPTKAVQLNRKIFFYRDPVTNEVLREVGGKKVEPIAYPYQYIIYELKDGKMLTSVEQGKEPRVQKISNTGMNRVRRFGGTIVFSAPLFLNFGSYQAYENYDFLYQLRGGQIPYQLTWNRRGSLPPFFGGGDSVFQLISYRVDRFEFLPKSIRDYLEQDAPLWKEPPRDLAEIRELQKQ